jgi:hypothetical protein
MRLVLLLHIRKAVGPNFCPEAGQTADIFCTFSSPRTFWTSDSNYVISSPRNHTIILLQSDTVQRVLLRGSLTVPNISTGRGPRTRCLKRDFVMINRKRPHSFKQDIIYACGRDGRFLSYLSDWYKQKPSPG